MNLANRILEQAGASFLAQRLPRAVLYTLDGLVGQMIDSVNLDTLHTRDLVKWGRPPFPACWVEGPGECWCDWPGCWAGQQGFLVETVGDSFQIRRGVNLPTGIFTLPCCLTAGPVGDHVSFTFDEDFGIESRLGPSLQRDFQLNSRRCLTFFLLLNCRNRILRVDDAPDLTRLNKARARRGRPSLLPARTVRVDLSRPIVQAMRRGSGADRAAVAAHVVRGHIKFRKSGPFWWSPHTRGGEGVRMPDYSVTASKPGVGGRMVRRAMRLATRC